MHSKACDVTRSLGLRLLVSCCELQPFCWKVAALWLRCPPYYQQMLSVFRNSVSAVNNLRYSVEYMCLSYVLVLLGMVHSHLPY